MRCTSTLPALAVAILCSSSLKAQPGEVDDSFGDNGIAYANVWGDVYTTPWKMQVLANGDMLVAGYRMAYWNDPAARMIRLTSEGVWIESFGQNGVVSLAGTGNQSIVPAAIVEQADGKIIVAFIRGVANNDRRQVLLRVDADGVPDATFGEGGLVEAPWGTTNVTISDMALDGQGRILLAGRKYPAPGITSSSEAYVMRLLPSGALDLSFGTGGHVIPYLTYVRSQFLSVMVLPDGSILAAGDTHDTSEDDLGETVVMRLLPDGTPDPGFGQGGVSTQGLVGVHLLFPVRSFIRPDGRIAITGTYQNMSGFYSTHVGTMCLLADGTLDTSFGSQGHALLDALPGSMNFPYALAVLEDQDSAPLIVAHLENEVTNQLQYFMVRQLPDGQTDEVFGAGGYKELVLPEETNVAPSAGLTTEGKLLVAGTVATSDGYLSVLARMQPTATFAAIPEHPSFLTGLTLFPNPVAANFTLAFQHEGDGPLRIELIDLQGRLVHRFAERVFVQGEQRLELAWPSDAAQGAYVLTIAGGQGRATVPLVR